MKNIIFFLFCGIDILGCNGCCDNGSPNKGNGDGGAPSVDNTLKRDWKFRKKIQMPKE